MSMLATGLAVAAAWGFASLAEQRAIERERETALEDSLRRRHRYTHKPPNPYDGVKLRANPDAPTADPVSEWYARSSTNRYDDDVAVNPREQPRDNVRRRHAPDF